MSSVAPPIPPPKTPGRPSSVVDSHRSNRSHQSGVRSEAEDGSDELLKMRLGTSAHHTNPRSRSLLGWKNSMPINEYRYVREQKRNQKNVPTTSSDWKEQHLIIAHRLAELEKRRVGTRYLPKGQQNAEAKKKEALAAKTGDENKCVIS